MNCGNCLMENFEMVRLNDDGTCPVCGFSRTSGHAEAQPRTSSCRGDVTATR